MKLTPGISENALAIHENIPKCKQYPEPVRPCNSTFSDRAT